ncbi:hypothetical protein L6164_023042 [Bauhinia variegata]|uniref:Uncharacterized protein n=1 Tax=Bauhinia variegata TaxID=167791 RepID=A0ACB9MHG0_BAUVA|nr:hypothetical protein L6164_023042 [Bauhinia variegata]
MSYMFCVAILHTEVIHQPALLKLDNYISLAGDLSYPNFGGEYKTCITVARNRLSFEVQLKSASDQGYLVSLRRSNTFESFFLAMPGLYVQGVVER